MFKLNSKQLLKGFVICVLTLASSVTVVFAATTISSNISTGGTLTVTGAATFSSTVTVPAAYGIDTDAAGQLNLGTTTANAIRIGQSGVTTTFPGLVSLSGAASSTNISASGFMWVGGNATTTAAGQITGAGRIGSATSSPSAEFAASGAATTTLNLYTSGANTGSCIELVRAGGGGAYRIYIGSDGTLTTQSGTCK